MKIILTEEQISTILNESIIKDVMNDYKFNTGVLFTFGTGMGAFMGPIERILSKSGFIMTKQEVALLIITTFALLLKDSNYKELISIVKDKELLDPLKGVVDFVQKIKDVINTITTKMLGVSYSLMDILGFAFLLNPIMGILKSYIDSSNITVDSLEKLGMGSVLAGIAYALKSMSKKLKSNLSEEIEPSKTAVKSICDSEKFCTSQGKITFGQLKALVDSATQKRLFKHVGEGGFKATLRLLPWFIPQLVLAGFITSSVRAVNKIIRPALAETDNYKTWWGKAVLKSFDLSEGELNMEDPLSRVFFMTTGLMSMLSERYKLSFAKYISELASTMPDNMEVPEFFVENELRHWLNEKFLIDPPLPEITKKPSHVERLSEPKEI
jgi:hypothetical protein